MPPKRVRYVDGARAPPCLPRAPRASEWPRGARTTDFAAQTGDYSLLSLPEDLLNKLMAQDGQCARARSPPAHAPSLPALSFCLQGAYQGPGGR